MLRVMLLAACVLATAADSCIKRSGTVEGAQVCNGLKYDVKVCKDGAHAFNAATVRDSESCAPFTYRFEGRFAMRA
jgi:hypothetical protein